MTPVPALEDLIAAAARDGATTLHLRVEGGSVTAMTRQGQGLAPIAQFQAPPPWLDLAGSRPDASRMDGRIVIRIDAHGAAHDSLARLGMPGGMRKSIAGALALAGGVVLAAAPDAGDRRGLAEALAGSARRGYAPWVAGERAALEAAARMDCDAILVDGLLDRTTAALAFDLARTGQRIVVASDAPGAVAAIDQLRGLRIERHLLGAGLRAVVAAHGARRLCGACRLPDQAQASESALLGIDPGTVIYRPAGCGACDGTGYAETALAFEAIAVDTAFHGLLAEGRDAALLARHAFLAAPTLAASARTLAREGRITAEEAIRIARGSGAVAAGTRHPHIAPSSGEWLDGKPVVPLSARLHGDRSSIG
ncbi:hypothetical protein [Sphingomonas sp.]|uniref:ATPase, T2SS/T4P/T4SS family n=1 Tax=Sphingomonas sp. TaxID=28214 RepID=UPI0031D11002